MFQGMEVPPARSMAHFAALSVVSYVSIFLDTKGYALATQGAGSVAIYKFLTPVFAMLLDVVIYRNIPNALNLIGMSLVLGSSVYMVHLQGKSEEVGKATSEADPEKGMAESEQAKEDDSITDQSTEAGDETSSI